MNRPAPRPSACERVRARTLERVEQGLPEIELARDQGHLEACAGCARIEREHRHALVRLGSVFAVEPEELEAAEAGLDKRLRRARAPGEPARSAPRSAWTAALHAAALAAAALVALAFAATLRAEGEGGGGFADLFARTSREAREWPWNPLEWPELVRDVERESR